MKTYDLDIVLATFNGARHLPELLASLDNQTDQEWRLMVRDDGSNDETVNILEAWGRDNPERYTRLEGGETGLGASGNFGKLLDACDARYFMLCDQDDVWLPDKVARLKTAIQREEAVSNADTPLIIHTDLIVTDEVLQPVAESFWEYQGVRMLPDRDPWKQITLQNVVTGCAMIGNAALLRAALPISDQAKMHDWWLALVCAFLGKVVPESRASVLYRQHTKNTLGAKKSSLCNSIWLALTFFFTGRKRALKYFSATQRQANAALLRIGPILRRDQADFLRSFANLSNANLLQRYLFFTRNDLYVHGLMRNIGLSLLK